MEYVFTSATQCDVATRVLGTLLAIFLASALASTLSSSLAGIAVAAAFGITGSSIIYLIRGGAWGYVERSETRAASSSPLLSQRKWNRTGHRLQSQ